MEAPRNAVLRICFAISFVVLVGISAYVEDAVATANMTLIEKSAERGDASAEVQLGNMYGRGEGEDALKHYNKAFGWFMKSANQGNPDGEYYVGDYYADGKGVAQNYSEARTWYCKSADQGQAAAQGSLGILYAHGLGVSKDYEQAYYWFTLAERSGTRRYVKDRIEAERHLTRKQIAAMEKYVREWKPGPANVDDSFGGCP